MAMHIPTGYVCFFTRWNVAGDPNGMFTHIGYGIAGTGLTNPTVARVNAAQAAFWTLCTNDMSNEYSMGPSLALIGTGGSPLIVQGNTVSAAGTAGGSCVPHNTALLVHKSGALPGRANQGRMYIPGVIESFVNAIGILTAGAIGVWQTNVNALMPGGTVPDALFGAASGAATAVIFHAASGPTPSTISSLTVDSLCVTQRRRMRR